MPYLALVSFYRSLARHKLYALLNVGGLATGIAVFLVLGLYVRFETSYETWLPRYEGIYAVQTVWNLPESSSNGAYPYTMGGLLDQMREDFPGVVGTRIRGGEDGGTVLLGGRAMSEDVAQVDASFLDVFDLPMARGDGRGALSQPTAALISERTAHRYFADKDPVGRALTIAVDAPVTYRVAGVFRDLPANTELKTSILIPLPSTPPSENWFHWGSTTLQTFLRFDSRAAARAFEEKMPSFVNRRGRELAEPGKAPWATQQLRLLPITRMHLEPEGQASASRKTTVVTLGLVGVLTLLIAIVNYINLATARAGLRAREVAMRKVLGADRRALVLQFLGEAIAATAMAALVGLVLAELGLPLVNAAGDLALSMPYALLIPVVGALVLIVGVAAGLYPAVLLSRFPVAAVLASARAPGGGRSGTKLREILVVLQFGLAIAFTIGTAVLVAQTRHVRRTDLGFQRERLIVVRSTADSLVEPGQKRAVAIALLALPQVTKVAFANAAVGGSGTDNSDNVPLPGVAGSGPSLKWVIVGRDFFETHGARLLAGRFFSDVYGGDGGKPKNTGGTTNIVINRSALSPLRMASPQAAIGKTVGGKEPRTIVGVVDDLRFASPRDPSEATYYIYSRAPEKASNAVATLRFSGDPRTALAAIRGVWQAMVPQVPFNGDTADRRLAEFYRADDRAARLFAIGAGLAVLISCVGLWGLASFNTDRRIKEIGIRKTLGASSIDIVRLLVGQFMRPVLIANVVAWPLAYVALSRWLAGFSDRVGLSPLFFVAATLLATAVAVLTVLHQSIRASRAAPAWSLRHD